jgi:hypothetical protein
MIHLCVFFFGIVCFVCLLNTITKVDPYRECINTGAAGAQTRRSLRHHLLHPQILRLLVILQTAPADPNP